MTTATVEEAEVPDATASTAPARAPDTGPAWRTLLRGLNSVPEFRVGLVGTLMLALVATVGRIVVPVAVQQTIDDGLRAAGGPDLGQVRRAVAIAAVAVVATGFAAYRMNVRLYRSTETGLAALRTRTFRHVHDLAVLTQSEQRRGGLVARVTTDVDQLSQFMQYGGVVLIVSIGQLAITTVLMLIWSWQLTILVYVCFVPLAIVLRRMQFKLADAYTTVRARIGEMLTAVSESVVGAQVVRAYGVEARTSVRIDTAIARHQEAATRAQRLIALTFSTGELVAGLATAGVVVLGVYLGVDGQISTGRLIAFLFLVQLFVSPIQVATEVLNDGQTAAAGLRRVLDVLDTPTDIADPADRGVDLPHEPIAVRFEEVRYAYPGGPEVLHGIDLEIPARSRVAIVGETGSGKTTFAKLLTRLMDPVSGRVLLSGVPLTEIRFRSLRERVVMVPQDGFLFDDTIAANVRYGRPEATDAEVEAAFADLGLADWLAALPAGVQSRVGERGEALSVGERQLVAVARAYIADPDLLVLDEATSAVDPATEVRLQRALDGLTRGRTSLAIAHRLSTAEAADEVLVVDRGRIVQRGPHAVLVRQEGSVYAGLHASWVAQQAS
jgi:putative ABC transport system ATP-binding protein